MKRLLMDLSVNCCGRSANLSLVESYVSWLERRHVTAVLRREHASPNLFTEICCDRYKKRTRSKICSSVSPENGLLAQVWSDSNNTGRQLVKSQEESAVEREFTIAAAGENAHASDKAQALYETVEVLAVLR